MQETFALIRKAEAAVQLAGAKWRKPTIDVDMRNVAILSLLLHSLRVSEVCGLRLEYVPLRERSDNVIIHAGKSNTYSYAEYHWTVSVKESTT